MQAANIETLVTTAHFDPALETARFRERHRGAGAMVVFLGEVRAENGRVERLVLEHYPGFTEKEIERIARAAASRWPLSGVRIVHRVGALAPEEPIVIVTTAAAHRRAAFEAAEFLMDYLKSEAPFWKKEISNGQERWIEPREDDISSKARWRAAV